MFLGLYIGNFVRCLRISLGDFHWSAASMLGSTENMLFWGSWFLILAVANIIFLNFIIAEASSSYESVNERIDEIILKERTDLVNESQVMSPDWLKTKDSFPKYIVIR
jgi:hypothetical protein